MHTHAALLADVQCVFRDADPDDALTFYVYKALGGKHDKHTFLSHFGTWQDVLLEAGISRKPPTELQARVCLRCSQQFMSWGIRNRLCHRCAEYNASCEEAPDWQVEIPKPGHRLH